MHEPHFGRTKLGLPVHHRAADHLPSHSGYARLNKKVAVTVTNTVGSMTCAYIFCLLALLSLPAVLTQAFHVTFFPSWLVAVGLIALVAWIAQTFLQLVLLSVIMVGQGVSQAAGDARAEKTFTDTEAILDRLDLKTAGGLAAVMSVAKDAQADAAAAREEAKACREELRALVVAVTALMRDPAPGGGPGTAGKRK